MAAGQFYKGKNLRLRFEGKTLFHSTNCSLSIASDVDDIATKDTNGKVIIPGSYSGTLSIECLVADKEGGAVDVVDPFDLIQYQLDKTELDWEFSNAVIGDKVISGKLYVTQSDLNAAEAGIADGSFSFTTNGDITIAVIA